MKRQGYAIVDLTVFSNGCQVTIFNEEGLQSIETKVPLDLNQIVSRLIGKAPVVLLKAFPGEELGIRLEIELQDLGFKIQKI